MNRSARLLIVLIALFTYINGDASMSEAKLKDGLYAKFLHNHLPNWQWRLWSSHN